MTEGDWVFVPPFMPHVEGNMSRHQAAGLADHPHAGEHRRQPRRRRRRRPRGTRLGHDRRDHRTRRRQIFTAAVDADARRARALRPGLHRHHAVRARGPRPTAATWSPRPRPRRCGRSTRRQRCTRCTATSCGPVDIGAQVRYEVERLRDGRGYSTRQVRGFQNGKTVYVGHGLLPACPRTGADFRAELPPRVPDPEALPSSAAYLGRAQRRVDDRRVEAYWSGGPQLRHAARARPGLPQVEGERVPHQAVWVKPFDPLRRRGAHRRPAGPRRAGLRLRLHDPRTASCACSACPGPDPGWSPPAWTTPCGSTADGRVDDWLLYAQEAGRRRRGPRPRPWAASSPATDGSWPPSPKRA